MSIQGTPIGVQATDVTEDYDPGLLRRIVDTLQSMDTAMYKRYQDILVGGDADSGGRMPRLILRSPDGNYWEVKVDNAGVLSTEVIPAAQITQRRGAL